MSISPVSSPSASSNKIYTPASDAIKFLEKQKENLQEQIRKTNESKMDDKAKQDRVKELQQQIEDINSEISQKQAEIRDQKMGKDTDSDHSKKDDNKINNSEGPGATYDSSYGSLQTSMSDLTTAGTVLKGAKMVEGIRSKIPQNVAILKHEIELAEAHSGGAPATLKRLQLREEKAKEIELNKKVGKSTQEVQKHLDTASSELKKDEKADDRKEIAPKKTQSKDGVVKDTPDMLQEVPDKQKTEGTGDEGESKNSNDRRTRIDIQI